jgi:hypothetical protein
MIDWIAAEAERVEESGVVRRRGRFCHESIEDLPRHTFPGRWRDPRELTTEGTEEIKAPTADGMNFQFHNYPGRRNGRGGFIGVHPCAETRS